MILPLNSIVQGDILSKTFPAPEKIDSGALPNSESVPGGALECEGELCEGL